MSGSSLSSLKRGLFLGAEKHLYKCVCPSVGLSIHLSVCLFITPLHFWRFRGVSKHREASISSCFLYFKRKSRSMTIMALTVLSRGMSWKKPQKIGADDRSEWRNKSVTFNSQLKFSDYLPTKYDAWTKVDSQRNMVQGRNMRFCKKILQERIFRPGAVCRMVVYGLTVKGESRGEL